MENEFNLDHYADHLQEGITEDTPAQVRAVIDELTTYALNIPTTKSREKKARPGEAKSDLYRERILGIKDSVDTDKYAFFHEFLAYIVWHEWQSKWLQPD